MTTARKASRRTAAGRPRAARSPLPPDELSDEITAHDLIVDYEGATPLKDAASKVAGLGIEVVEGPVLRSGDIAGIREALASVYPGPGLGGEAVAGGPDFRETVAAAGSGGTKAGPDFRSGQPGGKGDQRIRLFVHEEEDDAPYLTGVGVPSRTKLVVHRLERPLRLERPQRPRGDTAPGAGAATGNR